MAAQVSLTASQLRALTAAFRKGGAAYAHGSRAGGAYFRCCGRLVQQGLLEERPPFAISSKGLAALAYAWKIRNARHGSVAYLNDLEDVEAALAQRLAKVEA